MNGKDKMVGSQSLAFENPPRIIGASSVAGKKEGEGPFGQLFDVVEEDPFFGGKTWESAESRMQKMAADLAIKKAGIQKEDVRYMVAGDLLGQLIATSFGIMSLNIPMFGVYGACSTMGESMAIGAMMVDGGYADKVLAMTSSHFASAEKQFRFPLAYGNQRPLASTWTVTGSGAVVIASGKGANGEGETKEDANGEGETRKDANGKDANGSEEKGQFDARGKNGEKKVEVAIRGVTTGRIVDYGVKDSMNMGACMAPGACDVICANLRDFGVQPDYYDKIITGDLGQIGKDILLDMLRAKGYDLANRYMDCGIEIYYNEEQDTHAGGSGCGCSAITLGAYILRKMWDGEWKRVLFVPTGALLSTVSFNEGNSVPGIAHAVMLVGEE